MFTLIAQTIPSTPVAPTSAPAWAEQLKSPSTLIFLIVIVLWIFIFRSKKGQDKNRKDMLANLKKGDRIQTIGGILGTVIEAREADVLVKVDESSNTKIRFTRSAIHRVLEDGKPE